VQCRAWWVKEETRGCEEADGEKEDDGDVVERRAEAGKAEQVE
jgi:hypothetical protein